MLFSFLQRIPRAGRLAAVALWALLIPVLSLLPAHFFQPAHALTQLPYADKVVHATMYGTMTGLVIWALATPNHPLRPRWIVFTAASATAYGLLMEWLQHFTATRSMDIWDGVANATGAFLVAGVALGITRMQNRKTRNKES